MVIRLLGIALFVALCSLTSLSFGAGYIEKMDSAVSDLDERKAEAAEYEGSLDMLKETDDARDWAMGVGQNHCGRIAALVKEAQDKLEEDNNQTFLRESQGLFDKMVVVCLDALGKIEANSRKDIISQPELYANVQQVIDTMIDNYKKFKVNAESHAKALRDKMESKAKEWNRARADDEIEYRKATEALEEFIESNAEAVEKGEDLLDDLDSASRGWESASRSGQKDEIEEAYREYHEANDKMRNWKRAYSDLNRKYAEVFKQHHAAWVKFVKETKSSFELYDGEVAEANAAHHEFMKVMYGES